MKELVVKDCILSIVPAKMLNFFIQQRVCDLKDLESKSNAYFDATKDIFAGGIQPELNIGAAAYWQGTQHQPEFKSKHTFNPRRRGPHGMTIMCKFCKNQYSEKVV